MTHQRRDPFQVVIKGKTLKVNMEISILTEMVIRQKNWIEICDSNFLLGFLIPKAMMNSGKKVMVINTQKT